MFGISEQLKIQLESDMTEEQYNREVKRIDMVVCKSRMAGFPKYMARHMAMRRNLAKLRDEELHQEASMKATKELSLD